MPKKGLEGTLDKVFGDFIKLRDDYTCRRCGLRFTPGNQYYNPAHIKGRGQHSVRWDEKNVFGMCRGGKMDCHGFLDGHPLGKRDWYITEFGEEAWDELVARAAKTSDFKEWDIRDMITLYREKIRNFNKRH